MRLRLWFGSRRREETVKDEIFPERGSYKGIQYRVDGDSVILRWQNGRELEFRPHVRLLEEYDHYKELARLGKLRSMPLTPWLADSLKKLKPDEFISANAKTNAFESSFTHEQNAAAYGWTPAEYLYVCSLAGEILAKYLASRSQK